MYTALSENVKMFSLIFFSWYMYLFCDLLKLYCTYIESMHAWLMLDFKIDSETFHMLKNSLVFLCNILINRKNYSNFFCAQTRWVFLLLMKKILGSWIEALNTSLFVNNLPVIWGCRYICTFKMVEHHVNQKIFLKIQLEMTISQLPVNLMEILSR